MCQPASGFLVWLIACNSTPGLHSARQRTVSYLDEMGITDCYASPLFKARAGSPHGYDICDHSQLNPEIGTDMDFEAFTDALRDRGIGLILDVVPNHMSINSANAWWLDVLETGPSSPFAGYFDIDSGTPYGPISRTRFSCLFWKTNTAKSLKAASST